MNQWLHKVGLLLMGLIMVGCEDATIDYASDIVDIYFVETATIDGIFTDYTVLPLEEVWLIDITPDNLFFYENEINQCDTGYQTDTLEIESVTDTSIIFRDDTRMYYDMTDQQLTLFQDDDILTLVSYKNMLPPAVWTDPSLLTNDIYEPDSNFNLANRISAAGAIQTHYSAVCDDDDYYIFEALSGTMYVIEAEAGIGAELDLTLSLYSALGNLMDYNDDQTTTNVDPKLAWTCPDSGDGDYYFVVKKYWDYLDPGNSLDDEKGEYTIRVDVSKALLKAAPPDVIKGPRPLRASGVLNNFFNPNTPF